MDHLRWLSVREEKGLGHGEEERNCCLSENPKKKMEEIVPVRIIVPKRDCQRRVYHPCSPLSFCSHFCTHESDIQVIDPKSVFRETFSHPWLSSQLVHFALSCGPPLRHHARNAGLALKLAFCHSPVYVLVQEIRWSGMDSTQGG